MDILDAPGHVLAGYESLRHIPDVEFNLLKVKFGTLWMERKNWNILASRIALPAVSANPLFLALIRILKIRTPIF